MAEKLWDLVIIGGGIAGLGAAVYAGRLQLESMLIAEKLGGTIMLTDNVENYLGFERISGMELAQRLLGHARRYPIKFVQSRATGVERHSKKHYTVLVGKESFSTKTIIFATGTEQRKLNIAGESKFAGRGVHYCALCDGALYRNKVIGIVGGSDSAAKEALLLTAYGKKVCIIYRGNKIRAEPINLEKLKKNKKITIINNTNVVEIRGNESVSSVVLDKPYKGNREFALDALFVEIGRTPLSGLARKLGAKVNEKNEIVIDRESKTGLPGVFAAGDVTDGRFKQAITAAAEGARAAYSAYRYLNEESTG
jgi:thioredoxin reductase (NADPH)